MEKTKKELTDVAKKEIKKKKKFLKDLLNKANLLREQNKINSDQLALIKKKIAKIRKKRS